MKKIIVIILTLVPLFAMAQDKYPYELPSYTIENDSNDLWYIDDNGIDKHLKSTEMLRVISDTANTVRSEMADSIADLRGQISSGSAGWTYDGSVMHLTTNSDSVGIGTSAPTEKLEVVGNIKASGSLTVDGITNTGIMTNDTAVYINSDYTGVNSHYLRFGISNHIRNVGGYLELTDNSGTYKLGDISKEYIALSGMTVEALLPTLSGLRLGGNLAYATTFTANSNNFVVNGSSGSFGVTPHPSNTTSYYLKSHSDSRYRTEIKNTDKVNIRMVSNDYYIGDSTIHLLSPDEAEWDFTGEKITMSADELEVPANYTINTPALAVSDTLKFGDGWLYNDGVNGTFLGAPDSRYMRFRTISIFGDTYYGMNNVGFLQFELDGAEDYLAGFRSDTTRSSFDTAIAPSWDGLRKYVDANSGGGSGSIDTIKSTTPANLTASSYTHAVVYNSSTGRLHIADTTSSATFAGDVTFEGDVYMDALIKSDTTWIMVTPDGKLIPGDSITFASQGLTDELVPIEKYLSDVVDGELLWTWYDHTGRPWTIRGTGGTSPDKALNALTWQAEHLLRYNLALEKKVNGLIGLVVLLAGVIVIYGFIIIHRK
jgi:hypothetical protein